MNMLENAEHVGLKGFCFAGPHIKTQGCSPRCSQLCPWVHERTELITEHSAALLTSVEVIYRADHSETKEKHSGQQDEKPRE